MGLQLVILGVLLRVRRVRPRSSAVAATAPQCPFGQRLTHRASRSESGRRMTGVVTPSSIHVTVAGIVAGFFGFLGRGLLSGHPGWSSPVWFETPPNVV